MDTPITLLLVATTSLQSGALVTRVANHRRTALAMAGTNTALALAFSLVLFVELLQQRASMEFPLVAGLVLQVAAAAMVATGLARRREPGWLFWPVWLWNFALIYGLFRLRFFFLSGWSFG